MGNLESAAYGVCDAALRGSLGTSPDRQACKHPERMLSGQACWVPDTHPSGALFPGIQSIGQVGIFAVVQEDSRGHVPPAISSWVRAELGPF